MNEDCAYDRFRRDGHATAYGHHAKSRMQIELL